MSCNEHYHGGILAEQMSSGTLPGDPPAGHTAWDEDGNVTERRALTADEMQMLIDQDATLTAPQLVTVEVDPFAVEDALTSARNATTLSALRSAVIALAQQLQP